MKLFYCGDVVKIDEYVGYKINRYYGSTFTQPVMLQIFSDEFALPNRVPTTPTITGNILKKATEVDVKLPEETA